MATAMDAGPAPPYPLRRPPPMKNLQEKIFTGIFQEAAMRAVSAILATLLAGTALAAESLPAPKIDYWKVPWESSRPRDPDVDSNGIVWFVGQTGHYVASFDPAKEQFTKLDLDPGTGPHNLIVGEDRFLWYSGNRAAHIGRLDPKGGSVE